MQSSFEKFIGCLASLWILKSNFLILGEFVNIASGPYINIEVNTNQVWGCWISILINTISSHVKILSSFSAQFQPEV